MQAIILAAGMGKRLKEKTAHNTKCMITVNGKRLIDRMLEQLDCRGLSRIILVAGYKGQNLMDHVSALSLQTPVHFVYNSDYSTTNNIHSLSLAGDWLQQEDTLLLESDLIFEDGLLDLLLEDPRETLALVDRYQPWMDGTCVTIAEEDDTVLSFVSCHAESAAPLYKTVNVYKFGRQFSAETYVPFLHAYQANHGNNAYYEQVLHSIVVAGNLQMQAVKLCGQRWYEIDDQQDLDTASALFAPMDGALPALQQRYGGYWRCPDLLDFCYLVNPFFPSDILLERMEGYFRTLITSYPSGMQVIATLAADLFDVAPETILVGNGAAELILAVSEQYPGPVGLLRPSFDEYANRLPLNQRVAFTPQNPDFSYSVSDLMSFFEQKTIGTLVLVNPDNPSGNYIPKDALFRLIAWAGERGIRLIVDESFADFADEPENSLISQTLLERNPHLTVIKSLSKAYGIPGIRLGVLACADRDSIAAVKRRLSIWNINSFGEFFLQMIGKERDAYIASLGSFRLERSRLEAALQNISGIRVIPSQANYVMVQTTCSSAALAERLLCCHQILVKDLSGKTGGSYLRLAIRKPEENDVLLQALRVEMACDPGLESEQADTVSLNE